MVLRLLFSLCAILFTFTSQASSLNRLATNAQKYVGLKEQGNNRGAFFDMINRLVGNPLGSPHCAAFGYFNLVETKAISPKVKSGLATNYKTSKSISALAVAKGYVKLDSNKSYLVGWQKGNTIKGHLGIFRKQVNNNTVLTTESNTSSGEKGSQSDGDGVYNRVRLIRSIDYFRITYFTPVEY